MSIATVVLRGFGTSSYADINKLPTLGYSSAAVVDPSSGTPEACFSARPRSTVFRAPDRATVFSIAPRSYTFKELDR